MAIYRENVKRFGGLDTSCTGPLRMRYTNRPAGLACVLMRSPVSWRSGRMCRPSNLLLIYKALSAFCGVNRCLGGAPAWQCYTAAAAQRHAAAWSPNLVWSPNFGYHPLRQTSSSWPSSFPLRAAGPVRSNQRMS